MVHDNLDAGPVPAVLKGLSTIEKRCISLINTFFSLLILPAFPVGQFGMKGLVVHLPLSVAEDSSVLDANTNNFACIFPSSYSRVPQVVNRYKVQVCIGYLETSIFISM